MDTDLLKVIGGFLLALAFLMWGANALNDVSCHAATEGMKTTIDYSFFGGCRVQTPDGRMVPLDVYREVNQ